MTQFSLKSLDPLIHSLREQQNVIAVLCYGSYAEGTQDEKSDVDLLVICEDTIPSAEIRKELYAKNEGTKIVQQKQFENWETTWTPINDEFVFEHKKIEIGYNTVLWVNEVISKIIKEGAITLPNFEFQPYSFLGLLENARCLYEKNHYFSNLKKQARPFPAKLKQNIIHDNLSIFNESLEDLEDYVQRDIGVLAFEFHLFRVLNAGIQIIFAINETYYPASKREEWHLMRLSKLPEGFHSLIYDLLPVFYTKKIEIINKLKAIQLFIKNINGDD